MAETQNIPWKRLSAEVVAIVFGILLAFGVDAWYDGLRERERETDYQDRIATELRELQGRLGRIERNVRRSRDYAVSAAHFFHGNSESLDHDWLVVALYNIGRDYQGPLDISNYEDLVATGSVTLISDSDTRVAIQRAYGMIRRVEATRDAHRDQYLTGVRGWIPQQIVDQIRDACPSVGASEEFLCPNIDLNDEVAANIIEGVSTDQARLAFQLRHQGLDVLGRIVQFTLEAVDEALAYLD